MRRAVGLCVASSASYRPVEKCRPQTAQGNKTGVVSMIEGISAVTLGTHEMPRTVRFYRALGFEVLHGGEESCFTSLRAGASYEQGRAILTSSSSLPSGAGSG